MTGWTEEDMAKVAADELKTVLAKLGILAKECDVDDGETVITFYDIASAELMLTLGAGPVPDRGDVLGSFYDHVTGGCAGLTELSKRYDSGDVPEPVVSEQLNRSWSWIMHPHLTGRRVGWHIICTMPLSDVHTLTAALNSAVTA